MKNLFVIDKGVGTVKATSLGEQFCEVKFNKKFKNPPTVVLTWQDATNTPVYFSYLGVKNGVTNTTFFAFAKCIKTASDSNSWRFNWIAVGE